MTPVGEEKDRKEGEEARNREGQRQEKRTDKLGGVMISCQETHEVYQLIWKHHCKVSSFPFLFEETGALVS